MALYQLITNYRFIKLFALCTLLLSVNTLLTIQANSNLELNLSDQLLTQKKNFAVLVYGNELTAVAAAVMASRTLNDKGEVILIRSNPQGAKIGGLLVQGGLSYLDRNQIDPQLSPSSAFFREFLLKAQVKRVAADPNLVDKAARQMLKEASVQIVSGVDLKPKVNGRKIEYVQARPISEFTDKDSKASCSLPDNRVNIYANAYIDATQNADLARAAGLAHSSGFATLGYPKSTLPVSPVFRTEGLSVLQLQAIEKSILGNPQQLAKIKDNILAELNNTPDGLPPKPEKIKWIFNNFDKPMHVGEDFIDVRSIALGASYHLYRGKPYDLTKGFLFDKANIALLSGNRLSWNAFLYRVTAQEAINLVQGEYKPTIEMLDELKAFERWLHTFKEGRSARVIPPEELYVRHSLNITDVVKPLTGREILYGGRSALDAVGTFSYYFDVRGGIEGMKGKMPKVTFNFGIEHALSKLENLAIAGRAAGYYGLAPAVGRILELNVSIAAHLGVAAALSKQKNTPLNSITSSQAYKQMEALTKVKVKLQGKNQSGQVEDESRII